jgi:hypothetical protein
VTNGLLNEIYKKTVLEMGVFSNVEYFEANDSKFKWPKQHFTLYSELQVNESYSS